MLTAKFYDNRQQDSKARNLMIQARDLYLKWGAKAKVKQIENDYPIPETGDTISNISSTMKEIESLNEELKSRMAELEEKLGKAQEQLNLISQQQAQQWGIKAFIGQSSAIKETIEHIRRLQETNLGFG